MRRFLTTVRLGAQDLTVDFVLALGIAAVGTFGVVTLASWWM